MVLVSTLLTINNCLSWSIRIMLGLKLKLGFIDGQILKSNEDFEDFET